MDIKYLKQMSDDMHKTHTVMLPLWQNISMEVWPEMADFTETKNEGQELADHLMSGYPSMCRRELGDSFESMLRQGDWFSMKTGDPERDLDTEARAWLEKVTKKMKRIMYERKAGFMRACKQVDHGYAALGQWPMTIEMNKQHTGLLFRAWHLRDVAFQEDISGQVCTISHKMKLAARDVVQMFPGKCSDRIEKLSKDRPFDKVDIIRMILPTEMCGEKSRFPFTSVYFDPLENDKALEVVGQWSTVYRIPRWQTRGSVSQYAHSPAAMIGNPDARLFQQMTLSMLDAAEKGANPPMVASANIFREDAPFSANSIGWADIQGDEDIRKHIQVLTSDRSGMQLALEVNRDTKVQIAKAWYNDLLQPPDTSRAKTAYEASIIMQNHVRGLIPVFQPVSAEYQAPVCEDVFNLLMRAGAFGRPEEIPESLTDTELEFEFVSPLTQAEDQKKVAQFHQAMELLAIAAGVDPNTRYTLKVDTAMRDAYQGGEVPAKWLNSEDAAKKLADDAQAAAQAQQLLDQVQQGSEIAKNLGGAGAASGLGVPA